MSDRELYDTVMPQLQDVLNKIESGEKTVSNCFEAYVWYHCLNEDDKYSQEVEEYAQLTMQAALKEVENNNADAHTYEILAQMSEHNNDREKMFLYINKAIELDSNNADYYALRADFYQKCGNKSGYNADYAKVKTLDPEKAKRMDRFQKNVNKIRIFGYLITILMVIYIILNIFWR